MGCSYYLTCKKCDEAKKKLWELDLDGINPDDLIEESFSIDEYGTLIDMEKFNAFLEKHKDHGGIFFDMQC